MLRAVTIGYLVLYISAFYVIEPSEVARCVLDTWRCEPPFRNWLVANLLANSLAALLLHALSKGRTLSAAHYGFCSVVCVATIYSLIVTLSGCSECSGVSSVPQIVVYLSTGDPFIGIATVAAIVCAVRASVGWASAALRGRLPARH